MPALEELIARTEARIAGASGARVMIGIAGAPGSGKTTLAVALTQALQRRSANRAPFAAHVPMDGFHLADVELRRLHRLDRKGAPDTFDAGGYLALLQRLRASSGTVWAPAFDREIEQPIAASIAVEDSVQVVVSEGNYLLLTEPEWASVRSEFDEVWFCAPDEALRQQRLIARHERFGKSPEQAEAWALGTDQRNAELIEAGAGRADLLISGDVTGLPANPSDIGMPLVW